MSDERSAILTAAEIRPPLLQKRLDALAIILAVEALRHHRRELLEVPLDPVLETFANRGLGRGHRQRGVRGHPGRIVAHDRFQLRRLNQPVDEAHREGLLGIEDSCRYEDITGVGRTGYL